MTGYQKHKINVNTRFSGDIKIRGLNGNQWAPGVCLPTSMILFLLFPVLTLLFVSAYGRIISELLLEWSLAMICGHLFNNMLVWEGYTWNRSAKSGKKNEHILVPAAYFSSDSSIFRSSLSQIWGISLYLFRLWWLLPASSLMRRLPAGCQTGNVHHVTIP